MSGTIRDIYLDKQGVAWELVGKIHTSDYCYCTIRNVLTSEQITITSWKLEERYFRI